jgi:hypothetical protein
MVKPEKLGSSESVSPVVLGDTILQSETLESLASAVNYNNCLTSLAIPHLGDAPIALGSGLGDYAQTWLDQDVPGSPPARSTPPGSLTGAPASPATPGSRSHSSTSCRRRKVSIRHSWRSTFWSTYPDHVPFGVRTNSPPRRVVRRNTASEDVPPSEGPLLSVCDKRVIPRARKWESKRRAPFGLSVVAIARVPPWGVNCWGLVRLVEVSPTELVARVVRRKTPRRVVFVSTKRS